MRFLVRWPDRSVSDCYSPSLIVKDYLAPGRSYPLVDFVSRCRIALSIASERVRAKYGYGCAHAMVQLHEIEETAAHYAADEAAQVTVEAFSE